MKKKRKIGRWIILAVVVVAVLAAAILLTSGQRAGGQYTEETVRSGSLETYYNFTGNIDVRESQYAVAKANTTVREIYVEQDQQVAAGDPLLRLANGDVVKADIAGEVTEVHVSVDDTVGVGASLVDVINFEDLQVLLKVDEFDVAAVTAGKDAKVTIEALGLTYDSVVEHITKQAKIVGDVNYYEAKLPTPVDERILPGMKVDVTLLNERVESAVLLSMNALQFDDYNKPYVLMRSSGGDVYQLSVGVGIQDGTTVQITDGLRAGDTVLVPQSGSMFPMMQMRQRNGQ